ncbi:hypothetical protein GX48_04310 [Paracoccidioides brasiliensis]|nr:hypothetical protein GX48_04310 [Paracoccidioides brasiliensis]
MPSKKKIRRNATRLDKPDKPNQPVQLESTITTTRHNIRQHTRPAQLSNPRVNRQRQQCRHALEGNVRSQKTLTQIDFVKRAQALLAPDGDDNEGDLGYIDRDDGNGDYGLSASLPKRSRKSTGKGRGSSSRNVAEHDEDNDDRTLTQMGYVPTSRLKGHIGRIHLSRSRSGGKKGGVKMETIGEEPEVEINDGDVLSPGTKTAHQMLRTNKKRKASEVDIQQPLQEGVPSSRYVDSDLTSKIPVTPRKSIRLVVPSSQSPDSPSLLLCPRTFKETPPRFPLAQVFCNVTPKKVDSPIVKVEPKTPVRPSLIAQYEIPESPFNSTSASSPSRSCAVESPKKVKTVPATSSPLGPEDNIDKTLSTLSHTLPIQLPEYDPTNADTNTHVPQKPRKLVIYETDAESEEEEFHDTLTSHVSADEYDSQRTQSQKFHQDETQYEDINDLHGLPTQRRSSVANQETFNDLPGATLGSEPSMLYYRKPMSFAFDPGSELDNIDSQKLAELFPNPDLGDRECLAPPLSTIPEELEEAQKKGHKAPVPKPAKDLTEPHLLFVPDSPPHRHAVVAPEQNVPPPSSPPVLLVASSEQSDNGEGQQGRAESQFTNGQGLVTVSQLLTDSMMESVPGLPVWMSSQCLTQEEEEATVEE